MVLSGASVRPVPYFSPMPIVPAYIAIKPTLSFDTYGVMWGMPAATDFIFGIYRCVFIGCIELTFDSYLLLRLLLR